MANQDHFSGVVSHLQTVRDDLKTRLQNLEVEAKSIRQELDKTEAALQALSGRAKPRRKTGSGVTVEQLATEVARVRQEQPGLNEDELKRTVFDRVKQSSTKKLSGFALLFPKALAQANRAMRTPEDTAQQ